MRELNTFEAERFVNRLQKILPLVLSVACLLFFTQSTARAQVTTADIVGTATDPSGAALANGSATAVNVATGVEEKVALGSDGSFTFTLLQVGGYKVTVTAPGFKSYVTSVTLAAGDRARINANMALGAAAETITVESTTPALKTDDSTIGTLITSEATQDLPLNGRNVTSLVTLAAGVTGGLGNAMNSGTRPDDRRMSSSFAANGQSDEINNNMIDGMDNNERFIGSVGVRPSIDAIDQVKVLTNLYTAEVSRSGGGVVDLITKSGSNNFHGTLYEFLRNDKFDAKDRFATVGPKPELRQNQFGGSIGGPIKRDKAFFFFDIEDFRLIKGVTALSTVPTAYEEQHPGDFTDLGVGCTNLTTQAGWTPGKIGLNYLKLFPTPNVNVTPSGTNCTPPLNNYNFTGGQTQFIKTYDAKVDYRFSPRDAMFARYTYNDTNVFIPSTFPEVNGVNPGAGVWGAAGGSSFAGPAADVEHSAALDYNHLLSNSLILDLKAQYMRLNNNSGPVNQGKPVSTTFGFPCTATSCVNLPSDNPSSGLMAWTANADGYSPLGDAAYVPLLDQNNTFQYVGALSWLKGPHTIKMGASVIRRQVSEGQSPFPRGFMQDNGDLTGNPIGDMLSDYSTQVQRSNTLVIADFRSWEMGYYAQDDYRLKPNITLNLGVRYDVYTPFTSTNYGFSNFNPATGLLYGPGLPGAQQSNSTAGVKTDWSDLAPRLGFAWTARPTLVVRGGFGITFFPENTASGSFMRNAPYSFSFSCGSTAYTTAGVCGTYGYPNGTGATSGGYFMDSGLPFPKLNMALATDPNNYLGTTIQQTDFDYKNAYLEQYSLNVEKDIRGNVVTIAYVGNHGGRLVTDSINSNQLPIPESEGGTFPYPTLPGVNIAARKSVLKSLYNAGQVSVERRMHDGLAANVNYTWAHSLTNAEDIDEGQPTGNCYGVCHMDNGSGQPVNVNSFYQYDYGNADIDTRQRIALTMSYDLPFGKSMTGPAGYVVKGWSTNAIYYAQTGNPFTVQNTDGHLSAIGLGNDRPNQVKAPMSTSGFHRSVGTGPNDHWWDPTTLSPQGAGLLGNEKRNQYYGPGTQALGFSIFKSFPIVEQVHLQFRTELFNLLNTPTYGNPGTNLQSGFGSINSTPAAATPRQIQFALKLIF